METTDTKGNFTDGIRVLGWSDMNPLFCTFFDERVIESLSWEAAGFENRVQQYQHPARRGFGRRFLECRGYQDSTVV